MSAPRALTASGEYDEKGRVSWSFKGLLVSGNLSLFLNFFEERNPDNNIEDIGLAVKGFCDLNLWAQNGRAFISAELFIKNSFVCMAWITWI